MGALEPEILNALRFLTGRAIPADATTDSIGEILRAIELRAADDPAVAGSVAHMLQALEKRALNAPVAGSIGKLLQDATSSTTTRYQKLVADAPTTSNANAFTNWGQISAGIGNDIRVTGFTLWGTWGNGFPQDAVIQWEFDFGTGAGGAEVVKFQTGGYTRDYIPLVVTLPTPFKVPASTRMATRGKTNFSGHTVHAWMHYIDG